MIDPDAHRVARPRARNFSASDVRPASADFDEFYQRCDPERDNLCLFGEPRRPTQRTPADASAPLQTTPATTTLTSAPSCAGESDGSWTVEMPADEVPPELPEPCLGEPSIPLV